MRIEDAVNQIAKERFTNPTEDDKLFVAGLLRDIATFASQWDPDNEVCKADLVAATHYYESLQNERSTRTQDRAEDQGALPS